MKLFSVLGVLLVTIQIGWAQDIHVQDQDSKKGKIYIYWGWNRGGFSKSDIKFSGADYDFMLQDVVAKDRATPFALDPYFHPTRLTIPQYNFRIGYFLSSNWDISFGIDHMKYVVVANQSVKISGNIGDPLSVYQGAYSNDDISIAEDFLRFEHTDGLNYANVELRRIDRIASFKKIEINLTEGIGIGGLMPKTNTTLLGKERYDEFHWSGYGIDAVVGLNFLFFDRFFMQTEFKGGYINMLDIRTTTSVSDKASQSFFFTQYNIVFGATIDFKKKNRTKGQ